MRVRINSGDFEYVVGIYNSNEIQHNLIHLVVFRYLNTKEGIDLYLKHRLNELFATQRRLNAKNMWIKAHTRGVRVLKKT